MHALVVHTRNLHSFLLNNHLMTTIPVILGQWLVIDQEGSIWVFCGECTEEWRDHKAII